MKQVKKMAVVFSFLFLANCALGPLVVHEPARTVGDGKHQWTFGYGLPGLVVKWNMGLTENLDLGIQYESISFGARIKYAFINNKEAGWSLATAAGVGSSIGGTHSYVDLMGSFLSDNWEPYGAFRIVKVSTDPLEFQDTETGATEFTVTVPDFMYSQITLGSRYWLSKSWAMSLEASTLSSLTDGFDITSDVLVGIAFAYHTK